MKDKLLLVDDEAGIRNVLKIFLDDIGYQTVVAASGEEALTIFKTEQPPLVVTDVKMPGMSGIELLKNIKSDYPDTEVIVITGHGDMDTAIESLKWRAADFITKPINTEALEIALKRACEKIDLRHQLKEHTENLERMVQETSARLVAAERQSAATQVVEGLFTAIHAIRDNMETGFRYFDDMPCMVSIHSPELKVVAINPFYQERLGNRMGDNSWCIYGSETASKAHCPVAETLRLGAHHRTVESIKTRDGEMVTVIVHTLPIRNHEGVIKLVMEIACDLTGTENLHQDLEIARQRYRKLFDEVPCYISVQDRALRMVEINRRFKEDFGDRPGKHCFLVYKNREKPCTVCPVVQTFTDGKSHQHETQVTAKDGSRYDVLITTAPIRNAAGEITHVMEMSTNITEIRQLQSHLESLGLMIGTVSHSIKGMLTGLDGGIYILDSGIRNENDEEIQDGRDIIGQMTHRIKTAVLDILFYTKERPLKRKPIPLRGFAEDVALTMSHRMRENDIDFVTRFNNALGVFQVDSEALQSALNNILQNAVDACSKLPKGRPRNIMFAAEAANEKVLFTVKDNGIGMGKDVQDNLFKLFFSTKGGQGTGLGLFISKKIIDQHGGTISVKSRKGEGSCFTVQIG